MANLGVSQINLTKHSTLYRWNGHFGHLSEVIKNYKYQFWTFWTIAVVRFKWFSVMTLAGNGLHQSLTDPYGGLKND